MEFRSLRPEELEEWLDHCMYVFNGGSYDEAYRNYFMNHWFNDPWRDMDSILVAVEDGKILSTVRVFHRKMHLLGQCITMGGIGEVSTKPECQGLGLSTKLLQLAIERMEKLGMHVSLLGTYEKLFGYYEKLGWRSLPRVFKTVKADARSTGVVAIRPFEYDLDAAVIREIYQEYSAKLCGTVVRDENVYWERWMKMEYKNCLVAEIEGEIAAYLDVQGDSGNKKVREFGIREDREERIHEVLTAAADNLGETAVIVPEALYTKVPDEAYFEEKGEMIRLVTPFYLGNSWIESTEQLIEGMKTNLIESDEMIEGEAVGLFNHRSKSNCFTFWDTDGF